MSKLVITKRYPEIHVGHFNFEGKTVKEVLEEIKEFTNNSNIHFRKIEDYGNNDSDFDCDAWSITIDRIDYLGCWSNWVNKYKGQLDNKKVKEVKVSGGWYCAYDFEIFTEEYRGRR